MSSRYPSWCIVEVRGRVSKGLESSAGMGTCLYQSNFLSTRVSGKRGVWQVTGSLPRVWGVVEVILRAQVLGPVQVLRQHVYM